MAYVAIPVLLVAGIWLGFLGSCWGRLWIWVSLILLIGVGIFWPQVSEHLGQ